jgi:hypothetical protein
MPCQTRNNKKRTFYLSTKICFPDDVTITLAAVLIGDEGDWQLIQYWRDICTIVGLSPTNSIQGDFAKRNVLETPSWQTPWLDMGCVTC